MGLFCEKFLKAYYGFRVLYAFPFPSTSHWPIGSGYDKYPLIFNTNIAKDNDTKFGRPDGSSYYC